MTITVRGWNNERGTIALPVPDHFQAEHDLAASSWRMQVRSRAGDPRLVLQASSETLTASYSAGWVVFVFPLSTVDRLAGAYVHDFGFIPPGGEFKRVDGGAFVLEEGVTR